MGAFKSFGNAIVNQFKYPKPYNWGYPIFYGSAGLAIALLLMKLLFSGALPFSSTSLIGCSVITLMIVMLAFVAPSFLLAEHGKLFITGKYTGVGALILSFLSGAPLYLIKASFHNLTVAAWLKGGGSVVFPAVFYQFDQVSGSTLLLEILIDTVIPAFGFSLFFLGAVWQGFSEDNKRWAFIIIPVLFALFSYDFLDIPGILVIGWWLCMVRSKAENIYGPILALIGSRITGILIDSVVSEVDLTTIRVYSDLPNTIYYSSVPAIFVAVILLAFFRKTLGEFHFAYSADIYGDDEKTEEKDGVQAESFWTGINLTLFLGLVICIVFWFLLFKGIRL